MTQRVRSDRATHRRTTGCVLAILIWFSLSAAVAGVPDVTLAQMDHTSWTARDGAPQGILTMAQAPDGTLWIGAEGGLVTFDGSTFTTFQSPPGEPELPVEPVQSVLVTKAGTVWVGFYEGGIARIAHGHVTLYPKIGDQQLTMMLFLREAADGSIWGVGRRYLLIRFGADEAWHIEPTPLEESAPRIGGLFIDSSNTLWLAQGGNLYRRPLPQSVYTKTELGAVLVFGFAETPDGSIWMSEMVSDLEHGRTRRFDRLGRLLVELPDLNPPADLIYTPAGSVILGIEEGMLRVPAAALIADKDASARLPRDLYGPRGRAFRQHRNSVTGGCGSEHLGCGKTRPGPLPTRVFHAFRDRRGERCARRMRQQTG